MIDPRIYRAGLVPVLVALVVVMFSVGPIPEPVQAPETFAADFDGRRATATAKRIAALAAEHPDGPAQDEASADLVAGRFAEIGAGTVSEQVFDAGGEEARNVLLELPGTSARSLVVVANRAVPGGAGGVSGAAATGLLLEMAAELGRTRHEKTIVLVSAGGGAEGSRGIRELAETFAVPDSIDAVVAITAPGAPQPRPPHVLPWATEPTSTSAQLVESARLAVAEETGRDAGLGSPVGNYFRLAVPAALGPQAVAISAGLDAVAISASGERPPPFGGAAESISSQTMTEFGNATTALVLALDGLHGALAHGPDDHLAVAGNLIPGWAIALLALALLLATLLTAADGFVRAARRGRPAIGSLLWTLSRSLPFVAALAAAYLLAVVGIAPAPAFPFDPAELGLGWRAGLVIAAVTAAFVAALVPVASRSVPGGAAAQTAATAVGLVSSLSVLGIWLVNPYLALLWVPLAHVWLLAARPEAFPRRATLGGAVAIALVPPAAAAFHLAARLDVGVELPWQLLVMVTGGEIGAPLALLGCLLAGSAIGLLTLSLTPATSPPAAGPAGPGRPPRPPEPVGGAEPARGRPESSLVRSG